MTGQQSRHCAGEHARCAWYGDDSDGSGGVRERGGMSAIHAPTPHDDVTGFAVPCTRTLRVLPSPLPAHSLTGPCPGSPVGQPEGSRSN